ncbi:50S ribosomal protein L34 [Patescibacteria group bacterium]|nr:50S ribosomal protein L34 [Patescibacteria group bacterium]
MLGKLKKRKRLRKHGFRSRTQDGGGVLKSRRSKGRYKLTVTINSKAA